MAAAAGRRAGAPTTATARTETLQAEAAGGGSGGRRVDLRPDLLRARRPSEIAALEAAGTPRAIRFKVPAGRDRRSPIWCTARSRSTTRTSKTSSSCDRTASRPITCRSSSTTSTWRSRTSSAATITSRTRRSRCCSTRRSARTPPQFAHVPLILGPDKKRLSKRHGATSVMEYHAPRLPAGGDGQLPRAARLVAGRRPRAVHARRADRARSRSKASAAATPCSTRRSSTGSTSSTSCGCRRTSSRAGSSRSCARRDCGATSCRGRRARLVAASCCELLRPRVKKLEQFVDELRRSFRDASTTIRRRSRSTSRRPESRAALAALPARMLTLEPFDQRGARSGAARAGRVARHQSRRADSRDPRRRRPDAR